MFTCFVQLVQLNIKITLHEYIEKAYTARTKWAEKFETSTVFILTVIQFSVM